MSLFDKVKAAFNAVGGSTASGLDPEWTKDRVVTLNEEPDTLEEFKQAVNVSDPGSVAAYWLYSVACLTADYDTGLSMMKYAFADIEPFGRGFKEGGLTGGWDTYFNDRLQDDEYRWLPRAYFKGAAASNGFNPEKPLAVEFQYLDSDTKTVNDQSLSQLGRLNIVYGVKSNAAGNLVKITVSKFDGSNRWYVTSGTSCKAVFYDQRAALTAEARAKLYT
ncbi:MAG: hypothetical protein J6U10_01475 [Lachnospiraceae bacterium]|nr:hypothetical protein [Lachnospiraceae bacterium]MBP5183683.1 hypothetical protein [Lachnospiraceae bacterium]